ncbi:hypothetical protein EDF42_3706 [Curtobacterium sp. PhB172]|uniref:hypothetical protein n=1 Tax=Curtobacterium sp. PhB172 TaxID=2485196 RepID=UPI000FBD2E0B|nr:hypothetical protein [Curtobacterium sp. PhB172]ROS58460.1 hypothetical protein EDF42_3706 [Curtobacterium sp. PhB172]
MPIDEADAAVQPESPTDGPGQDPTGEIEWQELLFRRVTGRFGTLTPTENTEKAESILFGGQHFVYYGVGRNSPHFGDYVTVFAPVQNDALRGAVAPFDTGGIALRKIPVRTPKLTPKQLVARESMQLSTHQSELRAWIRDAFDRPSDYNSDTPGTIPTSPRVPEVIFGGNPDPRRWAWEGRLPAVRTSPRSVRLLAAYLRPGYLKLYREWLSAEKPLRSTENVRHQRNFLRVATETMDPYSGMMEALRNGRFS